MKILLAVVVFVMAAGTVAEACSCAGFPTLCEYLAQAEVAFVGTVDQGTGKDDDHGGRYTWGFRPAVMSVEKVVRGLPDDAREIRVNPSIMTSCYVPLKPGERWLILGRITPRQPDVVQTGGCSGSRRIKPGDTEIGRIVASYREGPNLFFGSVRLYKGGDSEWRTDNLVADAEVELSGEATAWSARTGESGRFEVRDLAPGEYQLTVSKPGLSAEMASDRSFREVSAPDKIVVPALGCVEARVLMWPDTQISGTVRTVIGTPVAGIPVAAYKWDTGERRRAVRATVTDENGRYVIPRLLPGRYAVGVNAERGSDGEYPTTFHPTAPTLLGAMPVTIESGKLAESIDILVPPKRQAVTIQVQVLWPDKRPVAKALVRAEHPENGTIYSGGPGVRLTDPDGTTTIRLREGTEYTLSATWQKTERRTWRTVAWHSTNRIRLIAAPEATAVLTLGEEPDPDPFR